MGRYSNRLVFSLGFINTGELHSGDFTVFFEMVTSPKKKKIFFLKI